MDEGAEEGLGFVGCGGGGGQGDEDGVEFSALRGGQWEEWRERARRTASLAELGAMAAESSCLASSNAASGMVRRWRWTSG